MFSHQYDNPNLKVKISQLKVLKFRKEMIFEKNKYDFF